jgi:hypothetical protein
MEAQRPMQENKNTIERFVLIELMRLNGTILGLALGLMSGFGIFLVTNILVLKGGEVVGPHLALLGQFFIGYTVTFAGSLIGFLYGFGTGFGIGYIVALLYNWMAGLRERRRSGRG